MTQRNPLALIGLSLITFGIYGIYWAVKTKGEMVAKGADIPTSWLLIVPFANIWWYWKFSEGVEHVTGGKMNGVVAFLLWFVLGFIGAAIIQNEFNNIGEQPSVAQQPEVPAEPVVVPGNAPADTAVANSDTTTPPATDQPDQATESKPEDTGGETPKPTM